MACKVARRSLCGIAFIIYYYYTIGFIGFQGQNSNFFQKGVQNNAAEIVENGEIRLCAGCLRAIPHKDCATDASSNFSSDETKSGVNTCCIHEHFCEI